MENQSLSLDILIWVLTARLVSPFLGRFCPQKRQCKISNAKIAIPVQKARFCIILACNNSLCFTVCPDANGIISFGFSNIRMVCFHLGQDVLFGRCCHVNSSLSSRQVETAARCKSSYMMLLRFKLPNLPLQLSYPMDRSCLGAFPTRMIMIK